MIDLIEYCWQIWFHLAIIDAVTQHQHFSCFLFFNPLLQQVVCTQWFQRWILVLSCRLVFRHEPQWSNFVQQWGRTGVNTQVWKHPEGHVVKRKIDQGGDKAVGSENARVGDVIAALLSVMILCNMLFVNSVMARRTRDVAGSDYCGDYQRVLCNATQRWCIRARCRFLSLFGDLNLPSNAHLKNNLFLRSVNLRFDQRAPVVWVVWKNP